MLKETAEFVQYLVNQSKGFAEGPQGDQEKDGWKYIRSKLVELNGNLIWEGLEQIGGRHAQHVFNEAMQQDMHTAIVTDPSVHPATRAHFRATTQLGAGMVLSIGPRDRAEEPRLAFGGTLERLFRDGGLVAARLVIEDRRRLEREAPVELGRLRAERRPERLERLELELVRAHLCVDDLDARLLIVPNCDSVDLERSAGDLRALELALVHLRREEVEVLSDVKLSALPQDLELSRVCAQVELRLRELHVQVAPLGKAGDVLDRVNHRRKCVSSAMALG